MIEPGALNSNSMYIGIYFMAEMKVVYSTFGLIYQPGTRDAY